MGKWEMARRSILGAGSEAEGDLVGRMGMVSRQGGQKKHNLNASDEAFTDWLVLTFGQKFPGRYWLELSNAWIPSPAPARRFRSSNGPTISMENARPIKQPRRMPLTHSTKA